MRKGSRKRVQRDKERKRKRKRKRRTEAETSKVTHRRYLFFSISLKLTKKVNGFGALVSSDQLERLFPLALGPPPPSVLPDGVGGGGLQKRFAGLVAG